MNDEKFWVVFVEGTTGGSHREHITHADAIKEAERLAALNKGKKVYCCVAANYCWIPETPIQWRLLS